MKKVETTTVITKYIAFDGTEFDNEVSCTEYENIIYNNKLKEIFDKCTINIIHSYDLLYCDENIDIYVVEGKNSTDINNINWYIEYWVGKYQIDYSKNYPVISEGKYVIIQDDDGYIYTVLPHDEYIKTIMSKLL